MRRLVFTLLTSMAVCVMPSASEATGLIQYTANPNPSVVDGYLSEAGSQPWLLLQGTGGTYYSGINDGGTLAWAQNTTGYNNYSFYQIYPTVADSLDGNTVGWTMTAKLRIPTTNLTPSWGINVGYTRARNWYMLFGADADGDPIVQTVDTGGGAGGGSYTLQGAGNTAYHTYKMVYDPTDGRVDILVDGVTRITDWLAGNTYASPNNPYFRWGDCGGAGYGDGVCNYNFIEWRVVPEPATVCLIGLGLGATQLFRRRRK